MPKSLALLGFRTSKKSVLIAMLASFITIIAWHLFKVEIDVIIPAMVINFIFLMSSHYLLNQPGGVGGNKRS